MGGFLTGGEPVPFISEFSQFVMDKSNSVIKFRDTKVQLMFENWSVTTKSLAMNKIAQ